ncbi:MAG TPA: hypothetical protein VFM19_07030 [Candidatus Limnocylindria bacterium]|nr:hypothetical protein [Candidatus Limnocylindria bacterium]
MSRRSSRRGRPYQPMPARSGNGSRILVIVILLALVIGLAVLSFSGAPVAPT